MNKKESLKKISENLFEYRGYHIKKIHDSGKFKYKALIPKYSDDGKKVVKYEDPNIEQNHPVDFKARKNIKDLLNRKESLN